MINRGGIVIRAAVLLLATTMPAAVGTAGAAALAEEARGRDVGRGEPLRKALLGALRPAVERDLGQKLIFVVHVLRVEGNWAFADLSPRTRADAPIDFTRTRHAERLREGQLDGDIIYALLRRRQRRWRVVAYAVGPTDVAWAGWHEEYGAPETLFRLPKGSR